MAALSRLLYIAALLAVSVSADPRSLLQSASPDGWRDGRATWYEHPWTGSCGYGKLDNGVYEFGYDAVAAMPDVFPDYGGSCGRCYEVKCRGIQAVAADGSVNLDRYDACYDTSKSIVIKIVDTCPCHGNEKWCCGDMPHFDLGKAAFSRLAPNGKGIIGLRWRPIPCEAAAQNGSATDVQLKTMQDDVEMGAEPDIFMNGAIGLGWQKTVYGDDLRAMYTYNSAITKFPDGSAALCDVYQQYGGADFHSHKPGITTFSNAKAVEFWAQTKDGVPDMAFRVANLMRGSCQKNLKMQDGITQDQANGWTRFYFPLDAFDCSGDIKTGDLNRVQWENQSGGAASLCVKDVRIVMKDETPVASAGR